MGRDPYTPEQIEEGPPSVDAKERDLQIEYPVDSFVMSVANKMEDTKHSGVQATRNFLAGLVYLEMALDALFKNVPKVLGNRLGVFW